MQRDGSVEVVDGSDLPAQCAVDSLIPLSRGHDHMPPDEQLEPMALQNQAEPAGVLLADQVERKWQPDIGPGTEWRGTTP